MKAPIPTMFVGLLLALAVGALVLGLLSARPGRVSMTLVKYTRWPHGAMLQLTNGTHSTIRYLVERNGTPAGSPVLSLQKSSSGWTNPSPTIKTSLGLDPRTGKTTEFSYLVDPAAPPKPGDRIEVLLSHDLRPGQSVQFWVRLEPDALPKRVGTICYVPQSALAKKLQPWLLRIEQWCRITPTPPGQLKVWCPQPLSLSSTPPPPRSGD